MPRPRFLNLPPAARARLVDIATSHFAKRGFEAASLNEILAEAGISKGSYYYYFEDKDDLFATTLAAAADAVLARVALPEFDRLDARRFWPAVERLVGDWASAFDASSDLFRAAVQLTDSQRRSPAFAPVLEKAQALYRAIIEPGRRLGAVRRDLPVAVLVRLLEANDAVLDGIFLARQAKVTRKTLDAHVRLVFDTFKRLLIADPFPPAAKPRRARGEHA
jgi:AcrR family transcriptional regulator